MTHLQIIQSLEEYKRQRINLPLPHAVKSIIENYVIYLYYCYNRAIDVLKKEV